MHYAVDESTEQHQLVCEPSANLSYTYADYLRWNITERIELLKGRILQLSAPNTAHQSVSGNLFLLLGNYLRHKPCKVFAAPFDVRLTRFNATNDEAIKTVVQPDICVICDVSKLDTRGCLGAPDLVVEILSPGNSYKEIRLKFDIYEEAGVKEYWIIHPTEQTIVTYKLHTATNTFEGGKIFAPGDFIDSTIIEGLTIDVSEVFENL